MLVVVVLRCFGQDNCWNVLVTVMHSCIQQAASWRACTACQNRTLAPLVAGAVHHAHNTDCCLLSGPNPLCSADVLRQTWHALRRLRRYDPELIAAMDAYMAQLPPADPPQLL